MITISAIFFSLVADGLVEDAVMFAVGTIAFFQLMIVVGASFALANSGKVRHALAAALTNIMHNYLSRTTSLILLIIRSFW